MSETRVLVVDDHPMFRLGVVALVDRQDGMRSIGEAGSGRDAIVMVREQNPDVVVTDLQMDNGDGLWLSHAIRREKWPAQIVVLTTFDGDFDVLNCLQAGVQAFVQKDVRGEDLVQAIREAAQGRQYISPEMAAKVATVVCSDQLTLREREILSLVAEGAANKEIAAHLGITEGTVKSDMNNMMSKLDVAGRTEAVVSALRRGIIRL